MWGTVNGARHLAGVYEARNSGEGQVVDISMTEGSAYLALVLRHGRCRRLHHDRMSNVLMVVRISIAATRRRITSSSQSRRQAKFPDHAREDRPWVANLPDRFDQSQWPAMSERLAAVFKTKTRDEWCEIMEGSDVCFAPVLTFNEAPDHPHNKARGTFVDVEGVAQPNPAPRFSRTPGSVKGAAPDVGADTREGLLSWGFDAGERCRWKTRPSAGRVRALWGWLGSDMAALLRFCLVDGDTGDIRIQRLTTPADPSEAVEHGVASPLTMMRKISTRTSRHHADT